LPRLPLLSTLFPYTTLFRSCSFHRSHPLVADTFCKVVILGSNSTDVCAATSEMPTSSASNYESYSSTLAVTSFLTSLPKPNYRRSEEHTSELQSRFDLVCRL